MDDVEVLEGENIWEHVFDNTPDMKNLFESDPPLVTDKSSVDGFSNPSPDSVSSWIGEIEHVLMNDDEENEGNKVALEPNEEFYHDFLSDILVDLPNDLSGDAGVSDDNNLDSNISSGSDEKDQIAVGGDNTGEADDSNSKKRKRQLRNRDAAVRSRERKKIYVRDLELKSRYLEGECRRLGRLLQCCVAENQALRLSLQSGIGAFGASMTKQESAVLLLESLLLGSLLWFLGIMCLFSLPKLLQSTLEAAPLEGVENRDQENVTPSGAGSKVSGSPVISISIKTRRCKASRTKMKGSWIALGSVI